MLANAAALNLPINRSWCDWTASFSRKGKKTNMAMVPNLIYSCLQTLETWFFEIRPSQHFCPFWSTQEIY